MFLFIKSTDAFTKAESSCDDDHVDHKPIFILSLSFFLGGGSYFRVLPVTYEGSQARGRIRAVATGLSHNHDNARSQWYLQPTPQFRARPDP